MPMATPLASEDMDHATQRHPPRHGDRRSGAPQPRLLHPHARAAAGQEDRQLRRPGHLPPLLRRRGRQPGTILTFFPWEHAAAGRLGVGQTQETVFRCRRARSASGRSASSSRASRTRRPSKRFGETVLAFQDPGRHALALVGVPAHRGRAGLERRRRSRPSTRSAASTASACCSPMRRRPARS